MSFFIIDRRTSNKKKSAENRKRFLERQHYAIKEAVQKVFEETSVDSSKSKNKQVKVKTDQTTIKEYFFVEDNYTGFEDIVLFGNDRYYVGDKIKKPEGGRQGKGGGAGPGEISEDDFEFILTEAEFYNYLFDGLTLPNLTKKAQTLTTDSQRRRAGITTDGPPSKLEMQRSMKNAIGRNLAMKVVLQSEIEKLEKQLEEEKKKGNQERVKELEQRLEECRKILENIPALDYVDLRYKVHEEVKIPSTRAVMFCVMDVSGSMGRHEKDLAKKFFMLLNLFLTQNYEHVELRFIRYHHQAAEVDEETFFYLKETGGTIASEAISLTNQIIRKEYDTDWNVYVAHVSDGDNWDSDIPILNQELVKLIPKCQYISYLEVIDPAIYGGERSDTSSIMHSYETVKSMHPSHIGIAQAYETKHIFKALTSLFSKEKK
jgi:hypothetical protein